MQQGELTSSARHSADSRPSQLADYDDKEHQISPRHPIRQSQPTVRQSLTSNNFSIMETLRSRMSTIAKFRRSSRARSSESAPSRSTDNWFPAVARDSTSLNSKLEKKEKEEKSNRSCCRGREGINEINQLEQTMLELFQQ